MLVPVTTLRERAQRRYGELEQKRNDPRYVRAIGTLIEAGLLTSNRDLPAPAKPPRLSDALFAGEVEPRVLELLPAIVIKLPELFRLPKALPDDLRQVVDAVRRGLELPDFRGVPASRYLPWIERTGRPGRGNAVMRSFRLTPRDLERLRILKQRLGAKSETEVLRRALKALESNT